MTRAPRLGHGVGLRPAHWAEVLAEKPRVGWFEVITENFLAAGGPPRAVLRRVREDYPIVLHGVSLGLGSVDPIDRDTLARIAALAAEIEPVWISEHISWGSAHGHRAHDLWPMPCTEEALDHMVARVGEAQDLLGRRLLLENISSYVRFRRAAMPEHEFVARLLERADCDLLLDVNNLYVNARNHHFDARVWLDAIPAERVGQIHLAGHRDRGDHLLDSHDAPVADEVFALYGEAIARFGAVPTSIEWDDALPSLGRLLEESRRAAALSEEVLRAAA